MGMKMENSEFYIITGSTGAEKMSTDACFTWFELVELILQIYFLSYGKDWKELQLQLF